MHWLAIVSVLISSTSALPPLKRHAEIWSLNPRAVQGGRGPLLKQRTPLNLAPGSLDVAHGCTRFVTVQPGTYCSALVSRFAIPSLGLLYAWNTMLSSDCSNLMAGSAYCVRGPSRPAVSSTPAVISPPSPTSPSSSTSYSGAATWFEAYARSFRGSYFGSSKKNSGLGACGSTVNGNSDLIVAVSHLLYDSFQGGSPGGNPNLAPICQKLMRISYGSKQVTVRVQDRCEGCAMNDVDLSVAAFTQLADVGLGRIPVTVRMLARFRPNLLFNVCAQWRWI